jgi:hypothetical protein
MTMPDNKVHCAAFLLREALALGIRIGTDGNNIVVHVPRRVQTETREWFYRQLYEFKAEIIAAIQLENAGGRS